MYFAALQSYTNIFDTRTVFEARAHWLYYMRASIRSRTRQKTPLFHIKPNHDGVLKAHSHDGRLMRPLISNISISSIDACERSERALGEIAFSHLKLGARLMMRGKGYTYQKSMCQLE